MIIHKHWGIPFLAKGAYSKEAGHWKCLGVHYGWHRYPEDWAKLQHLCLWGLVSFRYENDMKGTLKGICPGLSIHFASFKISKALKPARMWY